MQKRHICEYKIVKETYMFTKYSSDKWGTNIGKSAMGDIITQKKRGWQSRRTVPMQKKIATKLDLSYVNLNKYRNCRKVKVLLHPSPKLNLRQFLFTVWLRVWYSWNIWTCSPWASSFLHFSLSGQKSRFLRNVCINGFFVSFDIHYPDEKLWE